MNNICKWFKFPRMLAHGNVHDNKDKCTISREVMMENWKSGRPQILEINCKAHTNTQHSIPSSSLSLSYTISYVQQQTFNYLHHPQRKAKQVGQLNFYFLRSTKSYPSFLSSLRNKENALNHTQLNKMQVGVRCPSISLWMFGTVTKQIVDKYKTKEIKSTSFRFSPSSSWALLHPKGQFLYSLFSHSQSLGQGHFIYHEDEPVLHETQTN